jgi:monofunctional glycosyltransferase
VARKRTWWGRTLRWTFGILLAGILSSVLAVLALRWIDPPISAFMIEAKVTSWFDDSKRFKLDHRWVDLGEISPNLALAVVASEDQKFPEHWGFDVQAIEKAYQMNQHSHRVRGASTITQQVAKNLFLWSGRSYFRKGVESWFTLLAEGFLPKRRILEIYLNVAEFGPGIYGAEAAAQRLFHKPAARLTRSDAALLAAVLPNPKLMHANAPSAFVARRRDWILAQMRDLGGPEMLSEIDAYPERRRH